MGLFGKSSAEKAAERAQRDEEQRQARINVGTNKTNFIFDHQFTPNFFKGQERDYRALGQPQLNEQYGKAGDALTFDLARRGLTDSSVRGQKTADLSQLFTTQQQDLNAKAHEFATKSQNSVEDARAEVIRNLQVTGDAKGAASSSLARADALSQPPAPAPLTDLFTSFTNTLGNQVGLERGYAAGSGIRPRYNTGIVYPDAVKVS